MVKLVDTKDLKSLPLAECQFESGRGHHFKNMNRPLIISDTNSRSLKLKKQINKIFIIPIYNQTSTYNFSEFKKITKKLKIETYNFDNLEKAIKKVPKKDALLITGSLYLVGEFLKKN